MFNTTKVTLFKVGLFGGLLLCRFSLSAAETQSPANPSLANATPTVWAATGPRKLLGRKGDAGYSAEVPVAVIRDASKILHGRPSEWYVSNSNEHAPNGSTIVRLKDDVNQFICLAGPQQWVWLNTPGGLPYISELLRPLLRPAARLDNHKALDKYLNELVHLYEVDRGAVLSKDFLAYVGQRKEIPNWLGAEKNPQRLRDLFYDPAVLRRDGMATIRCNVLTASGSVEQWTVKVRVGNTIELIAVSVTQIRAPGTFNWPQLAC